MFAPAQHHQSSFRSTSLSSSNSLSGDEESSLDSNDNWDVCVFNSLLDDDFVERTNSSGSDSPVRTGTRTSGQKSKRGEPSVNEKEIKRTMRKRRAELSLEERKKEDKEAVKRYQFTFTRLFSHDIRRYIAQMHTNIANSPDAVQNFRSFFYDFALPDVQCTNKLAPSIYALPVAHFMTRDEVVDLWSSYVACHPDGAFKLLGTQVVRKYNSKTSEVRMTLHFHGTYEKIIESPSDQVVAASEPWRPIQNTSPPAIPPSSPSMLPAMQIVEHTPVNVVMYIVFVMSDQHLITHIEVDGRFVPDPTLSRYYITYKAENMAEEVVVNHGGTVVALKGSASDRVEEVYE